jgi:ribonuclease D
MGAVIATGGALAELARRVTRAPWIAVDTEADSLYAYPERLCLLQISVPGANELVDALASIDLAPLFEAMSGRELLFHGADYDLRLLARKHGFVPARVFDTMLAAKLLGETRVGLADVVERFLGVRLSKRCQKANWARRPLPPMLLEYARDDTRHLEPLAGLLRARLEATGRRGWHEESCTRLVEDCRRPRAVDPDSCWRLPGAEHLEPRGLAVLRALWQWRETEALADCRPPYFIVSHERLVELAAAAQRLGRFEPKVAGRLDAGRACSLRRAAEAALATVPATWPQPLPRARSSRRAGGPRVDRLRQRRDRVAKELGLDPAVVASRAVLERLAADPDDPGVMEWQRTILREPEPSAATAKADGAHGGNG